MQVPAQQPRDLPSCQGVVEQLTAALAAPFDPTEVKFKPAVVSGSRALALAYVDARVIQDRLDDVLGVAGWQDEYEFLPDGSVVCRLRLRLGDEWITKVDVGGPSERPDGGDRVKAAVSDALKRAAVKFGVGREFLQYKLAALPDFPGYLIGSDGTVWSEWQQGRWRRRTGLFSRLSTPPDNKGYPQVNLTAHPGGKKMHFKVHRLVMLAFIGPMPAGLMCRHLNGNPADNRLENLAYGTALDNATDTVFHQRTMRGEPCPSAKLTWQATREIRIRQAMGEKQCDLAAEFGVSPSTLSAIIKGKSWVLWEGEVSHG